MYSKQAIVHRFHAYQDALAGLPHRICYSVKANSNLAVLSILAREGAGFDIVSGGELYRVLAAGGDPASVVFSGVGKTESEIRFALEKGIHSFNCESETEIESISRIAVVPSANCLYRSASQSRRGRRNSSVHLNWLREHKFGVDIAVAEAIYRRVAALPGIVANGVSCHIGSQIFDIDTLLEAADKALALALRLRAQGFPIRDLDLGGGLGVPYRSADPAVPVPAFIERLRDKVQSLPLTLLLEPGRSIVAEAGILLTRVLLIKQNGEKKFVIVDAAMNDLIRPALYQAYHEIVPVIEKPGTGEMKADVAGPICETGDFFARARNLPAVEPGDLLAIRTAGAYGFALASNYNSRPRACELLVDGAHIHTARERETYSDLIRGESPLACEKAITT